MIKFTYNGHSYSFKPDTNYLTDSVGIDVARIELAKDSNFDEYNYYIDIESNEVMNSTHENEVLFTQDHIFLAGQYEAFNE